MSTPNDLQKKYSELVATLNTLQDGIEEDNKTLYLQSEFNEVLARRNNQYIADIAKARLSILAAYMEELTRLQTYQQVRDELDELEKEHERVTSGLVGWETCYTFCDGENGGAQNND